MEQIHLQLTFEDVQRAAESLKQLPVLSTREPEGASAATLTAELASWLSKSCLNPNPHFGENATTVFYDKHPTDSRELTNQNQ